MVNKVWQGRRGDGLRSVQGDESVHPHHRVVEPPVAEPLVTRRRDQQHSGYGPTTKDRGGRRVRQDRLQTPADDLGFPGPAVCRAAANYMERVISIPREALPTPFAAAAIISTNLVLLC